MDIHLGFKWLSISAPNGCPFRAVIDAQDNLGRYQDRIIIVKIRFFFLGNSTLVPLEKSLIKVGSQTHGALVQLLL